MYTINLHVNANGTIDTGLSERLRLGTTDENRRVKIFFEVDTSIEGTFRYLKLVNGDLACLYRITSNSLILNKTITSKEGIWLLSFISSDTPITNNTLTGSYAYISEPIEAVVIKGILNEGSESEETSHLKSLYSMNFNNLVIPDCVEEVGDYFLYESRKRYSVAIGKNVKRIGAYAFYKGIVSLKFARDSVLEILADNSLYNLTITSDVEDIIIPASVRSWGKNVFQFMSIESGYCLLSFERNSKLKTLGSYALWENEFDVITLPDHLETLAGNTYVIKNCSRLFQLTIPNTIITNIPANAIYGCPLLTSIVLCTDFNASANFSNCTELDANSIKNMFYALKNLSGEQSKSLTLGATNLAKVSAADKQIALNKNWTLS